MDHMATVAKRKTQVGFVGQVTKGIIQEMVEIEQFRRELEVHSGRALKKLRIVRSSKRLNTFIEENKLWHCNWNMIIWKLRNCLRENHELELREKVCSY